MSTSAEVTVMFKRRPRIDEDVQEWIDVAVWLADVMDSVERVDDDDAGATVRFFPAAALVR